MKPPDSNPAAEKTAVAGAHRVDSAEKSFAPGSSAAGSAAPGAAASAPAAGTRAPGPRSGSSSGGGSPAAGFPASGALSADEMVRPGSELAPGTRIEAFTIRATLGRGGMGVVYRADQDLPARTVALKLIRPGLATGPVLQRFAAEVQILGRLQHPGIAQIFEAGTTDLGDGPQPFFAMEYVEGRPLASIVTDSAIPLRPRLELFVRICDAVQHAHQKGVIHRDLKPTNILVVMATGAASDGDLLRSDVRPTAGALQPKVLDFGVARATEGDLALQTLHTTVGQLVGTLPYMSPEQIGGDPRDLDTRSDVYALGVILYELLAGRAPYELAHRSLPEVARIIREEEPLPIDSANRNVPSDLHWIVRKALEKDRAQRYASAGDLSADVHRFLNDEPILARRPTVWYQLAKFSRRNKTLVTSAVVVVLAVLGGLIGISAALSRALAAEKEARQRQAEAESAKIAEAAQRDVAERESRRARSEAEFSEAVNNFFDELLASVNPTGGDREMTVREVLDRAARNMAEAYPDRPLIEARLRTTIGRSYRGLGRFAEAGEQFRAALAIREREKGEAGETLESLNDVAINDQDQSRYDEAERTLRKAMSLAERLAGPDDKNTLDVVNNLGLLLIVRGRYDEAEPLLRRALETSRRLAGGDSRLTVDALTNLATLLQYTGRHDEAVPLAQESLDTRRRIFGPRDPGTLIAINNLGTLLAGQGKLAEAEPLYRESLDLSREVLGEDHPDTLTGMANLAGLLRDMDRPAEAESMHRAALAARRRVLGDSHADTIDSMRNLALTLCDPPAVRATAPPAPVAAAEEAHHESNAPSSQPAGEIDPGRLREAIALLRDAVRSARTALGPDAPDTLACLHTLGGALGKAGELDEAVSAASDAVAGARRTFGDDAIQTGVYLSGLGELLVRRRSFAEAEEHLLAAYGTLSKALGPKHGHVQRTRAALAKLYDDWNRPAEAAKWRQ